MPVKKIVDLFSGEQAAAQSEARAENDNATDEVKEFAAFIDKIIHMPTAEAYAALQTEKSIEILARMKVSSGDNQDIKGLFITILAFSKDAIFTDVNERRNWLSRINAKAKEFLPETRKLEDPHEFMPELNKIHAIVPLDGAKVIIEVAPNGRAIYKMKPQDLKLAYHNRFTKDINDKKVIHLDEYWLDSPARPNYAHSTFNPDPEYIKPDDTFNWWPGFAIKPKMTDQGQKVVDDVLEYVNTGLCKNNVDNFNWLIKWSAHVYQKPWEKPGTSVVIRSDEEGTGKSFYFKIISMLMDGDDGTHLYFPFSNPKMLTGDFSGHLENNLLLHSEEAFSAESRKEDSIIKNIIADDYVSINPKNLQARLIRSYHRVVFTGNPVHVIKVSVHGRRFFVLETSDKYRENTQFFGSIWKGLKDGGAEALMYYFIHVDLRDFDPRVALKTEYLIGQQIESFGPIEDFWLESLTLGETPFDTESYNRLGKFYVIKQKMLNHFNRTQKGGAKRESCNIISFGRQFAKFFYSSLRDDNGNCIKMLKDAKTPDGYNAYDIPSLPVARQLFENHMRRKYDWDDKAEWTFPPYNSD
jgi:Family of unknown function (DUF5906)